MAKFTIDMMRAEMEHIAERISKAQDSDRESILTQIDYLALNSKQIADKRADDLRARMDSIASQFQNASQSSFQNLSDQLYESVADILGNLQELKSGQKYWGNSIMDAIRNLGCRIGGFVSTPVILVEAIVSIAIGIVVGVMIKGGAAKVTEQLYDANMTPIGTVPAFTEFAQVGLGIAFGILATIIVFFVTYGITKLIQRSKK